MSRTDDKHLARAVAVAATSSERQKHGVCIAIGRRVIAVGVNRRRNDPHNVSDPTRQAGVHAEIAALRALRGEVDWRRVTVYSARVRKDGSLGSAKPCAHCQDTLDLLGITRIVYT